MSDQSSRRDFILGAAAGALTTALAERGMAQTATGSGIPTRPLGKTGARVSILGIGGAHIRRIQEDAEAIRVMHAAIGEGITFMDNAWCYHAGEAEKVMGKALAMDGYRKKVFLMTKNCGRDYKVSMQCLDDSLRRLQTDHVDLWQFHEVNYDNDPDWVFERGAVKAAIEARKAGKVRFIGFTGHKDPRIHLKMLSQSFEWDTCMMPVNVMDATFRSFQKGVIPVCQKRNVGVIGFKSFGGTPGVLISEAGLTIPECLRFSLSLPVAVQIVGVISMAQMRESAEIARNFKPMTDSEKSQLLAKVKEVAGDGRFEFYKAMNSHDGNVHREQHGFPLK